MQTYRRILGLQEAQPPQMLPKQCIHERCRHRLASSGAPMGKDTKDLRAAAEKRVAAEKAAFQLQERLLTRHAQFPQPAIVAVWGPK